MEAPRSTTLPPASPHDLQTKSPTTKHNFVPLDDNDRFKGTLKLKFSDLDNEIASIKHDCVPYVLCRKKWEVEN